MIPTPPVPAARPRGHEAALTSRVAELLRPGREVLKLEVARCFQQVAGTGVDIDLEGLRRFRALLAAALEVPEETLSNLQSKYVCFDFDGDGRLHFNEAYKLVKHHLWVLLKKHGYVAHIHIPSTTLDQAGFTFVRELGRGSQGVAMLVRDAAGRDRCAKRMEKGRMNVGGLEELREEFETLRRLSCRLIAQVSQIFQDDRYYYTVGEAYHGGDLTALKRAAVQQGVATTEEWWRRIFRQCVEALDFLHGQALMHCDVKEPNIMLRTRDFSAPKVVLIDFGVVKAMAANDEGFVGGTPGYVPPETWEKYYWFPSGDIFSLGVCMMQLLTDTVPGNTASGIFQAGCNSVAEVRLATLNRQPPFELLPPEMPSLGAVVRRMLQKDMALRPRAPQLLQDPCFLAGPAQRPPLQQAPGGCRAAHGHLLGTQGISRELYDAVAASATG